MFGVFIGFWYVFWWFCKGMVIMFKVDGLWGNFSLWFCFWKCIVVFVFVVLFYFVCSVFFGYNFR